MPAHEGIDGMRQVVGGVRTRGEAFDRGAPDDRGLRIGALLRRGRRELRKALRDEQATRQHCE